MPNKALGIEKTNIRRTIHRNDDDDEDEATIVDKSAGDGALRMSIITSVATLM
jgi:hypothetical protein